MSTAADATIVDAGIGNVRSVLRMFEEAGASAVITANPEEARSASRLVLPGVGAFDAGMKALDDGGWRDTLDWLALERRIPVLGICLGMQLLCRGSEEGAASGLGWIAGDVAKLDTGGDARLKLPHMGWADVIPTRANALIPATAQAARFYHVHKYRMVCDDESDVVGIATYGTPFVCAIQRDNIYGVQFHPEKSHRFGLDLLRRFAEIEA